MLGAGQGAVNSGATQMTMNAIYRKALMSGVSEAALIGGLGNGMLSGANLVAHEAELQRREAMHNEWLEKHGVEDLLLEISQGEGGAQGSSKASNSQSSTMPYSQRPTKKAGLQRSEAMHNEWLEKHGVEDLLLEISREEGGVQRSFKASNSQSTMPYSQRPTRKQSPGHPLFPTLAPHNLSSPECYLFNICSTEKAISGVRDLLDPGLFDPFDLEKDDLSSHIVLTHAIHPEFIFNLPEESYDVARYFDNPGYQCSLQVSKVFTSSGEIGESKSVKKEEYKKNVISRPHIHWVWNQLVQKHGPSEPQETSWEQSKIAVLEPMTAFENFYEERVFGLAPYDTLTLGSHTLSKDSIILVPEEAYEETKKHLHSYQGTVIPYDGSRTIRSVIMDTLKGHYPEVWHICDQEGNLLGEISERTPAGYQPETYLRKPLPDGNFETIPLIRNSGDERNGGELLHATLKMLAKNRFVGLHEQLPTFFLENERNDDNRKYIQPLLKVLREGRCSEDIRSIFAGGIDQPQKVRDLGSLIMLRHYREMQSSEPKRLRDIGAYLMKQAIYADMLSLIDGGAHLPPLEVRMILDSCFPFLLTSLIKIDQSSSSREADRHFDQYVTLLRASYANYNEAKEKAQNLLSEEAASMPINGGKPLCLQVGIREWERVTLREGAIPELEMLWPLEPSLQYYLDQVASALPIEPQALCILHHSLEEQVQNLEDLEPKDVFQRKLIQNLIFWVLKEKEFLSLREGEAVTTLYANKMREHDESILRYGMLYIDHTEVIGDCLFDNVSAQLEGSIDSVTLRHSLVRYMEKNRADYEHLVVGDSGGKLLKGSGNTYVSYSDWEEYLLAMAAPTIWGTELELRVLSDLLEKSFIVFAKDRPPMIYNGQLDSDPIFIHHANKNHFESCAMIGGITTKQAHENVLSHLQELQNQKERKASQIIGEFYRGNHDLTNSQIILQLKTSDSRLSECFEKKAGVAEGYSIEEHSRMVMDVFDKELKDDPSIQETLHKSGMNDRYFRLFLALHDIGKGRAVEEIPNSCPEQKKRELQYTMEIVTEYAKKVGIDPHIIKIYEALLLDNCIGDLLEGKIDNDQAKELLRKVAEHSSLGEENLLDLYICFHKSDASSYSFLRKNFFLSDPKKSVQIGGKEFPSLLGYCEVYQMMVDVLREELKSNAQEFAL